MENCEAFPKPKRRSPQRDKMIDQEIEELFEEAMHMPAGAKLSDVHDNDSDLALSHRGEIVGVPKSSTPEDPLKS